jgi:hypothetical protein
MSLVEFQTGLGRLLREQTSSDPFHGLNLDLRSNTSAQTLAQLLKQGTIEYAD